MYHRHYQAPSQITSYEGYNEVTEAPAEKSFTDGRGPTLEETNSVSIEASSSAEGISGHYAKH